MCDGSPPPPAVEHLMGGEGGVMWAAYNGVVASRLLEFNSDSGLDFNS